VYFREQTGDVSPGAAPITNPLIGGQPTQAPDPMAQQQYNNYYNPQEYKPEPLVSISPK